MENASKAIIIAGSFLVAILLISLSMFVFNLIGQFYGSTKAFYGNDEMSTFNRFFSESRYVSNKDGEMYGYDAYNIIQKARDINDDPDAPINITIKEPGITSGDFRKYL